MRNSKILFLFVLFMAILLQNCCTSQEGIKDGRNMEKGREKLETVPRGMAIISFKILKVNESNDRLYCSATVKNVHGYGNGVQPLAKETDYKFEVGDNLKEKINSLIGGTVKGKVIQQHSGINEHPKSSYKIISIIN